MPAPYRIADVIATIATYHKNFFEDRICNLVSNPRVTMAISQKKLALTTRPSCPKKYRLMPAPYRIADVIDTIATYHRTFLGQDLQPGFEPTSHHGYLTEEAGLNYSAILPLKISADAGAI